MDRADGATIGVPDYAAPGEFCRDAGAVLAVHIKALVAEGVTPDIALRKAQHLLLRMRLIRGELVASAMRFGTGDLKRHDLPVDVWPPPGIRIEGKKVSGDICMLLAGTWWSNVFIRQAGSGNPSSSGDEAVSPFAIDERPGGGALAPHDLPVRDGRDEVSSPEKRAVREAPAKSLNLKQQHYDRDACEIMAEVHRKGIAFADVLNQWIDAGKNTEVPVNGKAVGVSAEAYKKAIERYSVSHGRVQERRSRTS